MTTGDAPRRRENPFTLVKRLVSGSVALAKLEIQRGRQEMARLRERVTGRAVSRFEAALRTTPYLARHLVHHGLYRLGLVRY